MRPRGTSRPGRLLQIDPSHRHRVRTVASNLTCPTALSIDPLSGDLFTDDSCFGAGSDNPALWRISNPASGSRRAERLCEPADYPQRQYRFRAQRHDVCLGATPRSAGERRPTVLRLPRWLRVPGVAVSQSGAPGGGYTDQRRRTIADSRNFPPIGPLAGISRHLRSHHQSASQSVTLINNAGFGNLIFGPDGCVYAAESIAVYQDHRCQRRMLIHRRDAGARAGAESQHGVAQSGAGQLADADRELPLRDSAYRHSGNLPSRRRESSNRNREHQRERTGVVHLRRHPSRRRYDYRGGGARQHHRYLKSGGGDVGSGDGCDLREPQPQPDHRIAESVS